MSNKTNRGNFTINVNFNLRQTLPAHEPTSINAIVRFNNERIVISGIDKVEPRYWNIEKQSPKQHAANARAKTISTSLSNAKSIIINLFENYTVHHDSFPTDVKVFQHECRRAIFNLPDPSIKTPTDKSPDFLAYLDKFKEDVKSGKRVIARGKRKGQPYSPNTHKQYGTLHTNLTEFVREGKIKHLHFNDIDLDFYTSFREYFVVKCDKSPASFGAAIKCVKTIMSDAAEYGFHTNQKHKSRNFIKETTEADAIFLDNEKLDKLINIDLSKNARLNKVRDLFLIGAYTGLRFSDFTTIRPQDIDGDYIRLQTIKTGERVTIPITKNLKFVIDKYNGKIPPTISNQKFNDYLKDLGKLAEFTEDVSITKFVKGQRCITKVAFWELMSSHAARRSFATNMFKMGIPSILIMAITGHTTEKAFLTYIRMNNDDKAVMMMNMLKRAELKVINGGVE
ncbi:site-specific integrase [Mucilaginibacter paludis]|uniref:Integrase family protein n=1 Tax=Mucilaginibacter paludis DSM 18603 TaxID=714943 RepID=H1Y7C6_9SPHI|nr:site-specific integrase [Mucilaginibacter paludis]EHQ29013.1 integrase family protein [Mucilaginibacter paludis DSM 18603]